MTEHIDFTNLAYLASGSAKQRRAYRVLSGHAVMDTLRKYDAILAGTIPINIDTAQSDLDIICSFTNSEEFENDVTQAFGTIASFRIKRCNVRGEPSVVANFKLEEFETEIFGQAIPATEQMAYRHMVIEHKLLTERGELFRQEIVRLKNSGLKTEPAFALVLQLKGDPYIELLRFE